jgi:hypothetical protein
MPSFSSTKWVLPCLAPLSDFSLPRLDGRLLFGYAMPAFECFKTVEERPNDAHMLRFWCQYW